LVEERDRVTVRLPAEEERVKRLVRVVEFVQDSREVRCLSIDVFQRSDLRLVWA
jgi:hypothetical protein